MADLIISQPMTFTVDVKNGLVERPQRESLMRGDKMANRIIAELVYGSEPFDITGVTVKGKFCRPPSGDEIDLAGEAKGNVAEVQLTDQCYTSGGHYEARIILVLGGVERTVLFISGDVLKSGSGNAAGDEETGGSGGSTGSGLPAGGTNGQVLVKVSSAQGDAIWKTLTATDVGARPDNWMPTAADVGALPAGGTAVNATQLNGKDAKYYLSARNLLDNSDFRNPVNQRGQTGYNGNIYTIDRWILWSDNGIGSVSVEDGQLAFNPGTSSGMSVAQRIAKGVLDSTKTYTLAWCDHANQIHVRTDRVHYGSAYDYVDFVVTEWVGVKWAALYEGEYTADNLPPYVPKENEIVACLQYAYIPMNSQFAIPVSLGGYTSITFPFKMRATPTIELELLNGVEVTIVEQNQYGVSFRNDSASTAQFRFKAFADL
ncbi:MAG: hypothetical protein IJ337_00290 [Clostridia bacterium]|nr:hypothetical protein [Clostridia bacterium]